MVSGDDGHVRFSGDDLCVAQHGDTTPGGVVRRARSSREARSREAGGAASSHLLYYG